MIRSVCASLVLLASVPAVADDTLSDVQHTWAQCQYQTAEDSRETCFTDVVTVLEQAVAAQPGRADLQVWLGISKSSLAGATGGLGGLSLAKQARDIFQQVIDRAPDTLQGSAHTSLGTLYYKVPGWPIGFGSSKKAAQHLQKALEINPTGIDANFFYGEFLIEEGKTEEARTYLTKALQAPDRPGRPVADSGRRDEIRAALAKLNNA
ncbi:tetratricopeptide repeat protein [Pontibacterium granulatum]|uniref:tetratricopeptide repeat protein n=1 Tax=Pontibacterium granulatum TaxID=2036029 RepID=UPI00249C0340|nr:tetratricopeptide repeat protein [Pontibacterium granulatum]MDI3323441.1 tetratricopeptide repeat protein [Pontibacterium granulatum]